jgi:hypothetical protein
VFVLEELERFREIQLRPVGVDVQPMLLVVPFFSSVGLPLQVTQVVVGIPVAVRSSPEVYLRAIARERRKRQLTVHRGKEWNITSYPFPTSEQLCGEVLLSP